MFCPNCSASVPEGAATCEACGTHLVPAPPTAPACPTHVDPTAETSSLAIASLLLGIVSLLAGSGVLLILSILALKLGNMARNQIRESRGTMRGDELALVGMIAGGISLLTGLVICLFGGLVGFTFCLPASLGLLVMGISG